MLGALAHQDYPLALLVERLQPEGDPSRSPLFQAYFVLEELLESPDTQKLFYSNTQTLVDWGELKVEPFVWEQTESQYDLFLEMSRRGVRAAWLLQVQY